MSETILNEAEDRIPSGTLAVLAGVLRRLMTTGAKKAHGDSLASLHEYIKYGYHLGSILGHPNYKHLHGPEQEPNELVNHITHILHGFQMEIHAGNLKHAAEFASKKIFTLIGGRPEEEQKMILRSAYEAMNDYYLSDEDKQERDDASRDIEAEEGD